MERLIIIAFIGIGAVIGLPWLLVLYFLVAGTIEGATRLIGWML